MTVAPVLQLEAALLRRQLPDLLLRPGMTLAARVAERSGRHGIIVLAGVPLVAELPEEAQGGDKLRLLVQDTRGERVVMRLVQEEAAAAPSSHVGLPLPGGASARVRVDADGSDGSGAGERAPERAFVALAYESPALGTVGLRLELAPGAIVVSAELAAGRPL